MSLGVVIKGTEGVVLAADSRVTLGVGQQGGRSLFVNYDNATKLLSFNEPHNFVGIVTYGAAVIGRRTAHSFLPEFELLLGDKRLTTQEYAEKLGQFFSERWDEAVERNLMPKENAGPGMTFIVGGYDEGDAYGKVFLLQVPTQLKPEPRNAGEEEFGMTWGGQLEIGSRLVHGYDPTLVSVLGETLELNAEDVDKVTQAFKNRLEYRIPYDILPLQDCVDLATFMIRSTIVLQSLAVGVRGVGGPIEVATITRTRGVEYIQRKELHGEQYS